MNDLPRDYDAVVVGTGLTESIVSAALARIGKTVLHIDKNDYYGCEYSSYQLQSLIDFSNKINNVKNAEIKARKDDLNALEIDTDSNLNVYFGETIDYNWHNDEEKEKLLKQTRRFSIDLSANIFYANGRMVDLLVKSDVAKYCEFKLVERILAIEETEASDGQISKKIERVPTSRSDVFQTQRLTMIEKRLLMKFVNECMSNEDESQEQETVVNFKVYLEDKKKLPKKLVNYILNAISMCDESVSVRDGINECKRFLKSVNRYGSSPFLYQLYGCGELTQCFSRLSAVFGSIFYLNMDFKQLNVNNTENKIDSLQAIDNDSNINFNCKHIIMNVCYLPYKSFNIIERHDVSKCILITNKSIFTDTDLDKISMLFIPKTVKSPSIYLIEASSSVQVCPNGYYIVYMICDKKNEHAKDDFSEAIEFLYKDSQEAVIFSLYYSHLDTHKTVFDESSIPKNLHVAKGPTSRLDFTLNIQQAQDIFKKICPEEQFLPKPPEPEDIIFEGEEEVKKEEEEKCSEPTETEETKQEQEETVESNKTEAKDQKELDSENAKKTENKTDPC